MSVKAYEEFNVLHDKYEKEKVLHSEAEKYAAQVSASALCNHKSLAERIYLKSRGLCYLISQC